MAEVAYRAKVLEHICQYEQERSLISLRPSDQMKSCVLDRRHCAAKVVASLAEHDGVRRIEAADGCQLDVLLYSEALADDEGGELLYPHNALRNAALLMARTELLFILDGDMLIGSDLSAALSDDDR